MTFSRKLIVIEVVDFNAFKVKWTVEQCLAFQNDYIYFVKPAQVYGTSSIADALKTGERNPIIQRTFDHYFSAFLQSSNSLKQYEGRNFILQRILASFASLGAFDQAAKRYLKRLLH